MRSGANGMNKRLSNVELAAIRERVEKATPGPWIIEESRYETNYNVGNSKYDFSACLSPLYDAEFIAEAREDVPDLLSLVDQQQAEIERLRQALGFYADESSYIDFIALQRIEPTVMIDKGEKARQALKGESV
ncbi:ead/Ea22-like family protein [Bacillus chungangensis]|uniref:Ead/Ea22-like family protein n=1 Tax=Bacillus chungangensis TaxID=587633 RepID=A0ABT9WMI4_9BACI|nr:hypothetical protein [Bacillus chungangensis]MDQ0174456.1 hypothetical protein [Bacillus chungangensis]